MPRRRAAAAILPTDAQAPGAGCPGAAEPRQDRTAPRQHLAEPAGDGVDGTPPPPLLWHDEVKHAPDATSNTLTDTLSPLRPLTCIPNESLATEIVKILLSPDTD